MPSKARAVAISVITLALVLLGQPGFSASPKAGATCTKAGLTATASGFKFTCVKSGKKLIWNSGTKIVVAKATPTPTPTPTDSGAVQPNGKCTVEGAKAPLNSGQVICQNGTWQPFNSGGTTGATGTTTQALVTTTWAYLSVINSGGGLGNVADASLVQTPSGDIRVYFKNGNDSGAKLTGFDNFIHSAISKDGGKSWTIESGVRIPITSPAEVLPKSGGGYQAWGWSQASGKEYLYYAESSDGLTFTEISIPGIDVNKCLTTAGVAFGPIGDPAIVKLADGTWLLHAQGSGVGNTAPNFARWACVATSPDGKTWTPVQSRSYGGTIDVESNPTIYMNKSGKVEWMWPGGRGVETRIGDGTTYGDAITYPKAGDPERLDLADGTELFAMGGFDNRGGGALIFAKRVTNSYVITPTPGAPTGGSPNRLLTWTVKGASAGDISVMNFCLNKKVTEISGATVTITTSNGVVTVVSADPANEHACVYVQVGPEKILG